MIKYKVLLIDDEFDFVDLLKKRLENYGYEVLTASDGDEGLTRAESEKPDVIVLDIMMPVMDGLTFVKVLKSKLTVKHIPIIVLTAREGMANEFKEEGVYEYVVKPYDTEKLIAMIQELLSKDTYL